MIFHAFFLNQVQSTIWPKILKQPHTAIFVPKEFFKTEMIETVTLRQTYRFYDWDRMEFYGGLNIYHVLGLRYDVINRVLVAAGISLSTRHLDERVFRRRGPSGDGIAESASERAQHLSILGLPSGATELEAKEAYRALVKKYHPDRLAGRGASAETLVRAEAIMVKLNAAYKGLTT